MSRTSTKNRRRDLASDLEMVEEAIKSLLDREHFIRANGIVTEDFLNALKNVRRYRPEVGEKFDRHQIALKQSRDAKVKASLALYNNGKTGIENVYFDNFGSGFYGTTLEELCSTGVVKKSKLEDDTADFFNRKEKQCADCRRCRLR